MNAVEMHLECSKEEQCKEVLEKIFVRITCNEFDVYPLSA